MSSFTALTPSDSSQYADESAPILGCNEQKAVDVTFVTFKSGIDELKRILRLSWPIILGELVQMLPLVFNLRMAGMLMASATLATMVFLTTGMPILMGIFVALETLASQAFTGSGLKHRVGIYSQRAAILAMIAALPIIVVCLNSRQLLLLLGQDHELARLASSFLRYFIFAIPPYILNEVAKKFLNVQGMGRMSFYVSLICAPLHIAVVRVMVLPEYLDLGLIGLPLTTVLTTWVSLALLVVIIAFTSARACWGGFSREALQGWGEYIRIAFPGMVMMAGIVWPIEFISLVASFFGPQPLSSQSITNTIFQLMLLVHAGISTGTAIGVGNRLGGSLPNRSRLSANSVLAFVAMLGTLQSIGLFFMRDTVVGFFTKDPIVHKLAIKTVAVVAVSQPFKALGSISSGILRGQGRQRISAFFKLTACYLLALPLGLLLAHRYQMGLLGLWIGVGASWAYAAVGELTAVLYTDWTHQVLLCQQRMDAYGSSRTSAFL